MLLLTNIKQLRCPLPEGWATAYWLRPSPLDARRAYRADVVLVNCDPTATLWWCLLRLLPFAGFCLVSADIVLIAPIGARGRLSARVKRWLFRRVDLFILVHRNAEGYGKHYGIGPDRTEYVPFKVNLSEFFDRHPAGDDGYWFAGGVTHRDWRVLLAAWRRIDAPLVISIPNDDEITHRKLRTQLPDVASLPHNVRVVRHGPEPDAWLPFLCRARAVVLPIHAHAINPAGISTYLTAMAMGKPVVLTRGPSSDGMLTDREAVLVPPSDPDALRSAVLRLECDESFRAGVASLGQRYALACNTTARLHEDYLRAALRLPNRRG